jgi:ribosomal protein S21
MKQPIAGLKGIKPRLEKPNGKLSREEAHKLDREYRIHRNQALQLRNHREGMLLAKSRGQLIEKKLVTLQAAYLLTAFRSRVLAEPSSLVRRLVDRGFVAEERRTEVQKMIKHDLFAMLRDLANLPSQISDPNWVQKIDSDLRDQVEDGDDREVSAGGFVEDPSTERRRTEQAERRRERKTETMRKLREEGRIKS